MAEHLPEVSEQILPGQKIDVIAYGCTSGTIAIGEEHISYQVKKSKPVEDKSKVIIKNIEIYKKIKDITDAINLSSIFFSSYLIIKIPLGYIIFFSWFDIKLINNWNLKILIPHAVDPAHPPINIKNKKNIKGKFPQSSKLVVTYPVPVRIEIILNDMSIISEEKDLFLNKIK